MYCACVLSLVACAALCVLSMVACTALCVLPLVACAALCVLPMVPCSALVYCQWLHVYIYSTHVQDQHQNEAEEGGVSVE
jgi:hypothetical protein